MSLNKKFDFKNKEGLAREVLLLALFAGIAILAALADRAPLELETISADVNISQKFIYYWQGVVYRFFPGPYVYRVLVPYSYRAVNEMTHTSLISIDLCLKIMLLIACQYSLLKYLAIFFDKASALMGVFLFDSLLGYFLSFIKGPSIIETIDILNFLILTLGLTAIYMKEFPQALAILVVGLLNRETPVILLPILFTHEWIQDKRIKHSIATLFACVIVFAGIRVLIPGWAGSSWFNVDELQANLPFLFGISSHEAVIGNLRLAALLGPFALIGLYRFDEHPQFLKIAAVMVPALILIHYFTGRIIESRLWMPLFPFLIPLTLNNLLKLNGKPVIPGQN